MQTIDKPIYNKFAHSLLHSNPLKAIVKFFEKKLEYYVSIHCITYNQMTTHHIANKTIFKDKSCEPSTCFISMGV